MFQFIVDYSNCRIVACCMEYVCNLIRTIHFLPSRTSRATLRRQSSQLICAVQLFGSEKKIIDKDASLFGDSSKQKESSAFFRFSFLTLVHDRLHLDRVLLPIKRYTFKVNLRAGEGCRSRGGRAREEDGEAGRKKGKRGETAAASLESTYERDDARERRGGCPERGRKRRATGSIRRGCRNGGIEITKQQKYY